VKKTTTRTAAAAAKNAFKSLRKDDIIVEGSS